MKKVFLLALPLMLLACNSVEKHRGAIESLAAEWTQATNDLTGFSEKLNNTVMNFNTIFSDFKVAPEEAEKLTPEVKASWDGMVNTFMQKMQGFGPIQHNVGQFMSEWSEKTNSISQLTSGLNEGKLSQDLLNQIPDLKGLVSTANENLKQWGTAVDQESNGISGILNQMKAVYQQIKGGE